MFYIIIKDMINADIEYKKVYFLTHDNPCDFFDYCLKNELYKNEIDFSSRLKNVYTMHKLWQGASAVVALYKNKPLGICILEHRFLDGELCVTTAGILKMNSRAKNPWQKKMDWSFIHAGFVSFYVKPEYRNKGIATSMLKEMENLVYHMISKESFKDNIQKTMPQNCISVTCREGAKKFVKSSTLLHGIECDTYHNNFDSNISHHTYQIFYENQPKKSIGEFKAKKLIIENDFATTTKIMKRSYK